jgi:AraC family transcriptional regulator
MNWRIEERDAFEVVGVDRRFKNDESDNIAGFWDEKRKDGSLDRLKKQGKRNDLIAVCGQMDEKAGDFLYMIGLFADKNTDSSGFTTITSPAATWAVFRSEDFEQNPHGTEIPKLFESAYKQWLPTSGYDKVESEIYDMEIYGVTDEGKFFEEVWLTVKKA